MSRATNAARTHRTRDPQTDVSDPANDTEQSAHHDAAQPASTLTDAHRARYILLAAKMRVTRATRLPTWASEHLDWMDDIVATAWGDRTELAKVALGGHPITTEELDDASLRVEFARDAAADAAVPINGVPASNKPELMSDEALDAEMRLCQTGVCDGLVPWFRFSPASAEEVERQRKAVQTVRRGRARGDLVSNDLLLFKVCNDKGIRAWLQGLPKGEAALLERLRVLHRERVRRNKGARAASPGVITASDLPVRAYLLAKEPMPRITAAGRYLVKGRPEREGDYAGFKRRSSPTRTVDAPVRPVNDPVEPPVVR